MSDLIDRQAAIDELVKMLGYCFQADEEVLDAVVTTVRELPYAQPEIIRCRDCRYYNSEEKECLDLLGHGRRWEEDDFCSYGVKMEEVTE